MLKNKLLAAGLIALASYCTTAAADSAFYIGPSLLYSYTGASGTHFQGLSPRMSFGYGGTLTDSFYLGGELFAIPGQVPLSNSTSNGSSSLRTSRSFGASIIPGIMLDNCNMVYARVGIVNSYFLTPGSTSTGAQVGVGIATNIAPKWDLRGEYIYTAYRSISDIGSPHSSQVAVGVVRRFNF